MREIDGSFDFCDRYYEITLKIQHRSINCAEASPCLIENFRMLVSKKWSNVDFCSVQFSPLTDWVVVGTWGTIQQRSSSSLFCRRPLWAFWHWQGCPLFDVVHPTFACRPRRRPPSKVPWRIVSRRLSWRVTCPNHASFRLLTVARRGSCGPKRKLILLRTQSLVLCSK